MGVESLHVVMSHLNFPEWHSPKHTIKPVKHFVDLKGFSRFFPLFQGMPGSPKHSGRQLGARSVTSSDRNVPENSKLKMMVAGKPILFPESSLLLARGLDPK